MNEDKQAVCDALHVALSMTRHFSDLIELRYESGTDGLGLPHETVTPVYTHGNGMSIDVTADSCWALIKDVVKHLEG